MYIKVTLLVCVVFVGNRSVYCCITMLCVSAKVKWHGYGYRPAAACWSWHRNQSMLTLSSLNSFRQWLCLQV